jgi:glycosyltransferase involved in cell wall biosynthesis
MTAGVTVDVAGGPFGGAARFRSELYQHLARTGRRDIRIIGAERRLDPAWLLRRELAGATRVRRVALNNVGFVAPGGERWTLLGNALHFLNGAEMSNLDPSLRPVARQQALIVRLAARRSDVLVAPCSAMAERVISALPSVRDRLLVRMHPVSAEFIPRQPTERIILCPIIFEVYKNMIERLEEWVDAVQSKIHPEVQLLVTAAPAEVPTSLANNPWIKFVGRLNQDDLNRLWSRSRAIFFPTGLESFGFPLAEARVNGIPAIARDTAQNREIAGPALCGFTYRDAASLRDATVSALTKKVTPDPRPFDADAYFSWMLGAPR